MINEHAPQATQDLINDLRAAVPEVQFDRLTRLLYSTDASIYQVMPVGVAFPRNADEVSAAVEISGKHNIPILPRGGGSSLAGQAVGHALVLDLSRHMNRIVEINPHAKTVRAQAGVTLSEVNNALSKHDLMFGPDPASADRATIGGVLGNNATGAHSIVYGMTVDHVLATDVILSDGSRSHFDSLNRDTWEARVRHPGLEGAIYRAIPEILERYAEQIATHYPKTFRQVAGYNLAQLTGTDTPNLSSLIVGSEGTLGVITEARLNLVPVPKVKRLAMVHFSELRAALEAVPAILESQPASIELLDKVLLDLTGDKIEYRRLLTFVHGDPEAILLIEYAGETEAQLDKGLQYLQSKLAKLNHTEPVVVITDPAQQANVWYVRKLGLGILMSLRGDTKPIPFIEDAAVPVDYLAEYVEEIFEAANSVGVKQVALYGHASAGCLHIRPLINLKTKDGVRQMRWIAEKSVELVTRFGGTTSGEHGEGFSRGEFSEWLFGPELVQAFHQVKAAFDPDNLMNPGKVVDPPKMNDESLLRFGSQYATPYEPRHTIFGFHYDGGFAKAVEMCNGAGVCRKLGEGVMCPSFQVTHDEAHSTRGRANALRTAMMGLQGPDGMTSQDLHKVLDLCLSCQACKTECPSAVDLAKIKAEFLHGYYKEHGIPLRSRIFGHIATLNKIGQPFAPFVNTLMAGPGKWVTNRLGIHPKRPLPKLASQPFSKWYKWHSNQKSAQPTDRKQIVFFHDTFMEHNNPHVGQAAITILEAAGYETILLPDKKCCGRPAVSKGLLDEAVRLAKHNIPLLAQYARQDIPIVGCEPSCIGMLVDEYPDLVPGSESRAVAEMATTIDKFLVKEAEAGQVNLNFDETLRQVLFHGHCQQKALFGTEDTIAMLKLIPNCEVKQIESGCCGMAGSFGYEAEHYDLSIKLAEMRLAPAVRAAPTETIICATGTSCRDQIEHTTGRRPIHPIEALAEALIR